MKQESILELREELKAAFEDCLEDNDTIGALAETLENNAEKNQQESGESKCQYTLMPKFKIDFTHPGSFKIEATCDVEEKKKRRGKATREFTTEGATQQEFQMNNNEE